MDAIGRNHRLETAVADIVDNSIDAGATKVLLRFVIFQHQVRCFYVVDNGRGMTRPQINDAMTAGGIREYGSNDLGHFGLGLKAASLSQAESLTVISVADDSPAVGRRWLAGMARSSFECDVVGYGFSLRELGRPWGWVTPEPTGTVVRWDVLRAFRGGTDGPSTNRFVQDATRRLQQHLGLVFHRYLESGRIQIMIDVENAETATTGPLIQVRPLDPFGYPRTGAAGYPKQLSGKVGDDSLDVVCHIWPGRSQLPQFRLPGGTPDTFQGLYFYRHDRLLQIGGWNDVEVPRREWQLARVCIDVPDLMVSSGALKLNPEKSKVECGPEFADVIQAATAEDGTAFGFYLETARNALKEANRRKRSRAPIVPLGRGVPARVRQVVMRELEPIPGYDEVDIRWKELTGDGLFEVDRDSATIWLNSRYRKVLAGPYGALNDAPLIKTMLFLLVEQLFHGSYLGPKDKDDLELWQVLLTAAAKEEAESS